MCLSLCVCVSDFVFVCLYFVSLPPCLCDWAPVYMSLCLYFCVCVWDCFLCVFSSLFHRVCVIELLFAYLCVSLCVCVCVCMTMYFVYVFVSILSYLYDWASFYVSLCMSLSFYASDFDQNVVNRLLAQLYNTPFRWEKPLSNTKADKNLWHINIPWGKHL